MRFKRIICAVITGGLIFANVSNTAAVENDNLTKENFETSKLSSKLEDLSLSKKEVVAYEKVMYKNPSFEEIEKIIEEVAVRKGIPPTILKSVAYTESNFRQFKENGQPYIYNGISYGIMQVTPQNHYNFNIERLKYDIKYNIECGADIILNKWNCSFEEGWSISQIGDMDPRVLENWYFTLWAYNSWNGRNNPNAKTRVKQYQFKVMDFAKRIFGQDITPINKNLLPKSGTPDSKKVFETPNPKHIEDFIGIKKGDIILDGSFDIKGSNTILKDKLSGGKEIGKITPSYPLQVLEEPVPVKGKLMYKVKILNDKEAEESVVGWAELKMRKDMRSSDLDNSEDVDVVDVIDILQYIEENKRTKSDNEKNQEQVNDKINKYDINYDNKVDTLDVFLVNNKCEFKIIDYKKYGEQDIKLINKTQKVKLNKKWTIKFNHTIDETIINGNSIIALNGKGEFVEVELSIGQDNKSIIVDPLKPYKLGERYYFIINDNIKSAEGTKLDYYTIMKFIIEK